MNLTIIQKAARFLDSEIPDWHERINLETLNIQSHNKCVLGQLFGGWDSFYAAMLTGKSYELFSASIFATADQWKPEILARRQSATANKKVPLTAYGDDVQCPSATPVEALIGA